MTATAPAIGWAFAAPSWLWLLALLPLALWWRWRQRPRVRVAAAGLAGPGAPALPRTWRTRGVWLPGAGELLAVACLVVAAAQPVQRVAVPPTPPGRDIMLCLDVSSSMAARDLAADRDRLRVGSAVAAQFVQARPHDRIGVLTFARYPDLRCPLTHDHVAVADVLAGLRALGTEDAEDATAIGGAVARAAAALARPDRAGKVVVLVTDGEENVADELNPEEIAPLHAAQLCAAAGIRVHTVTVGRGNQKADGRFVPLDTTAVRQLAAVTGGRHFTAADGDALAAVYAAIDALEAMPASPPGVREVERAGIVLVAALLAWLLAHVGVIALRRLP